MNPKDEKRKIRKKILVKRDSFSKKNLEILGKKILKKFFQMPEFENAKTVSFFVSIRNEVSTQEMIRKALLMGKKVVVPCVDWRKSEMQMSEILSPAELVVKKFSLLEPKSPKPFPVKKIDLIVVPGLAFDEKRQRIGYGKGFYDDFLAKLKKSNKKAKSIGLAFDFQILKKIPTTSIDKKVDKIITEKRII